MRDAQTRRRQWQADVWTWRLNSRSQQPAPCDVITAAFATIATTCLSTVAPPSASLGSRARAPSLASRCRFPVKSSTTLLTTAQPSSLFPTPGSLSTSSQRGFQRVPGGPCVRTTKVSLALVSVLHCIELINFYCYSSVMCFALFILGLAKMMLALRVQCTDITTASSSARNASSCCRWATGIRYR